jgi:hypothetical protein
MKKEFLVTLAALSVLASGCMVKPPDDGLGAEVSAADVETALDRAEMITNYDTAFRTGDTGTVIISTIVSTQSYPQDLHSMSVTSTSPKAVVYHDTETVYNQDGTTSTYDNDYQIDKPAPAGAVNTFKVKLPPFIEKPLTQFVAFFKRIFSKITIEPSTAVATDSVQPGIHRNKADQELLNAVLRMSHNMKTANTGSGSILNTMTASSSPSPTPAQPTPDPGPQSSSRYFGLTVADQTIRTANCSQIPGCMVNGTHIEFKEIVTQADSGTTSSTTVLWSYDVSTQVPGLFVELNVCAGQIVNGSLPVKQCRAVTAFQFGSAQ